MMMLPCKTLKHCRRENSKAFIPSEIKERQMNRHTVLLNWGKDTLLLEISLFWQILTLTGGKNTQRLGDAVRQWAKKRTVNSKGAAGLADSSLYASINVCATHTLRERDHMYMFIPADLPEQRPPPTKITSILEMELINLLVSRNN